MSKKAAEYGRFSSDMQREESIDAQLRAIREYADREDYEIVGTYTDEAITGKTDARDDFQRMIGDAMAGKFDYILVHKFNRFARNKFDSVLYKKRLRDIGVRVVSVTQKIDDTPEGAMLESIIESMDEYYSANLALEVMKGLKENALKGGKTGGKPPLGYSYDEHGKLVPNEQAFLVTKIFDMYINGYGKRLIANTLNEEGYRSQTGKEFRSRTIGDILNNEKYIGTYVYTMKEYPIKIENNHEPIISEELWQKKCEMHKKRFKPRMDSDMIYHLTGKMFCGECEERYSGGGHKKMRDGSLAYYYVCNGNRTKKCSNNSVNKQKLEAYICDYILNNILNDMTYAKISVAYDKALKEFESYKPTVSLDSLRKERKQLNQKKDRFLDLYADGVYTKEKLYEKTADIDKRLKAIESQIKAVMNDDKSIITKEAILNYLKDFKANFNKEDKLIVKALIDTFVESIVVFRDKIKIIFRVDLTENADGERSQAVGSKGSQGSPNTPYVPTFELKPIFFYSTITRKELKRQKGY